MTKGTPSEVHAYAHILNELTTKKGYLKQQIYTQQECLRMKPIAEQLGDTKPENIVKISETIYYLIESKNERNKVNLALKEAREDYAEIINRSNKIKVLFITGIAGNNTEGFIAKSQFFQNGKWSTVSENDIELTGLLSKHQIERLMETNNPNLKEFEISDKEFLKAAEDINGYLHEGGINKDLRAKIISAILLALVEGPELNLGVTPHELITSINTRVDLILKKDNKSEFSRFIKIDLPSSTDNHIIFQTALVNTIQELLGLNIRSAMRSGKDVLGQFYEVFLKYGNGAKEIGIVLTPRHVTKLAAEVMDIKHTDFVLDPTCGTGGFLVAAFDEVKKKSTKDDFEAFARIGLYGIEQQDPVVSLALVNMIFRGDGKNNIIEGDCFAKWLETTTNRDGETIAEYLQKDSNERIPPITKVLMNPPFPKKKTDKKEFLFIEQALKQMQDGMLLFSVLPYSCLVKSGSYLSWRKRLLANNTILAVVTFPEDLFYPVGVHTLGIFIKKGVPYERGSNVLWVRALNDGLLKRKGRRLPNVKATNDFTKIKEDLKKFLKKQDHEIKNIPRFSKLCPIDCKDKMLELVPENYLDDTIPTIDEIRVDIDKMIRGSVSFLVAHNLEDIVDAPV